jgi:hypothetical protein
VPLPQSRRDLHREIETISYINDKPSVRRAIEPFPYQRDQWNENLFPEWAGKRRIQARELVGFLGHGGSTMGRAIVEEIATLASLALFVGMVAIWAQVIATL